MKVLQKTAGYTVYQKRSGRHAVKSANNSWVNGDDKVKILLEAGLIKASEPKVEAEETAAEPEQEAESPEE